MWKVSDENVIILSSVVKRCYLVNLDGILSWYKNEILTTLHMEASLFVVIILMFLM
jgi:hypothetical protein